MTDPKSNWPKRGDKALNSNSSSFGPTRFDALVMPTEGAYLVGFLRSADMIVDAAKKDRRNPDDLFFPIAYLYRHHLELMLKQLIHLGVKTGAITIPANAPPSRCPNCGQVARAPKDPLSQHNLHQLWNKAKLLIEEFWPDSPDGALDAVEQVILELHKLDGNGQAFRYAFNIHGDPSLQGAPDRVDLNNMRATIDAVSNFLEAAYTGIDYCDPGSFT